jgi:hypothetical protein
VLKTLANNHLHSFNTDSVGMAHAVFVVIKTHRAILYLIATMLLKTVALPHFLAIFELRK